MRLNRFADYGLRALIYLGTHERRVTTEEIASAYRISRSHLQKIIRELGRLGVVTMHRGRSGGLELSKAPAEISIGHVLRALDSETRLVECFDPERDQCTISPVCGLKEPLAQA
ncbi:MAG: Rrf2 family transcriptional regulator, partial [Planctomycetota bacterium]